VSFSHVFITRPRLESQELAASLTSLGLQCVVQPAFNYVALRARDLQQEIFNLMERAAGDALVIFTSPRAVAHGLPQLPDGLLFRCRVAAIGPATAAALAAAGVRVGITPQKGYTSEALLDVLSAEAPAQPGALRRVFIIAAPGGRRRLHDGLETLGWQPHMVMVYKSEPAGLDKPELEKLRDASGTLAVWTSANAMNALSQRLPPAIWFKLCRGDWLVISDRLKRLARAYGPARIHLAQGPGNRDLLAAIRMLA
jgi:uroporphyrinogen-III synthase